jgi:hypothetical protein
MFNKTTKLGIIVILAVAMFGCATTINITQSVDYQDRVSCTLIGQINTGTDIICSKEGVVVHRNSASQVVNSALVASITAAIKAIMHF